MTGHGPAAVIPESIKDNPDTNRLESIVFNLSSHNPAAANVDTLAFGTLEGRAQVIAWSCPPETNLVLYLRQRRSIEIPRDRSFKRIKVVCCEALSTPCSLATGEAATGVPIVRANNPRPKGDMFLTPQTRYVQFVPPGLALA